MPSRVPLKYLILLFIPVLLLIIFIWQSEAKKITCKDCNVILVSLDTLSALHLPCYGYDKATAPNLCEFAKKNIYFTNSYSQSPTTLNSHFSIFTSLYPHTHQMNKILTGFLDEKYLTLAQVFRNNGYQTMYFGPIYDNHMPLDRGIEKGFNTIEKGDMSGWNSAYEQLIKNSNNDKPTFLFLHTYFVHDPYLAGKGPRLFTDLPEYPKIPLTEAEYRNLSPGFLSFVISSLRKNSNKELLKKFNEIKTQTGLKNLFNTLFTDEERRIFIQGWNQGNIDKNDPGQIAYLKALYDEKIYQLDQNLAKLFELINKPELAKKTILIITADHGEEFMEHGNLYHGRNLYRTSTAVPLIMYLPGIKPKEITQLVQGIDIYPTVLSLTGLSPQSLIEGKDISDLIFKKDTKVNEYVLSEYNGIVSIQDQEWRYYYKANNEEFGELFNIQNDPMETTNLKNSEPQLSENMINTARKIRKEQ